MGIITDFSAIGLANLSPLQHPCFEVPFPMRIPTGCEETRYAVDRLLVVGHGWSGADFSVHLTHYVEACKDVAQPPFTSKLRLTPLRPVGPDCSITRLTSEMSSFHAAIAITKMIATVTVALARGRG